MSWVDTFIHVIRYDPSLDVERRLVLADSAFQLARKAGDLCRQAHIRSIQALELDDQGQSDSALTILLLALRQWTPACDTQVLLSCYNGLAYVYLSLGDPGRVDSITRIGLTIADAGWPDKGTRLALLSQLAIARASMGNMDDASGLLRNVLREAEEAGEEKHAGRALINLGTIKGMMEDPDSAYYFFSLAANRPKARNDPGYRMPLLTNMARIDIERGRYRKAGILLDSVFAMAEAAKNLQMMAVVQTNRSLLYEKQGDFRKAYEYAAAYSALREQVLDEERVRSVSDMMEKYQSELRESQIKELELEKLDATLRNERVTSARNTFMLIGLFILVLAIGLWARLRYIRRSRAEIQKERDVSDELLLNILPASVATELKERGRTEAKSYDLATILFSDFKDFTNRSEEMTPAELVREVDTCFKAFDAIMTQYGLEKVKTIGDSYMAAAAIGDISQAKASDAVLAALAMQAFIEDRARLHKEAGKPYFQMRVGLNSGPVVAGIVGVKKFQFDLWGDTVNTASRMETYGEIGKVNISDSTYQLIRSDPAFAFQPRGMAEVKGKGLQAMYFVELANP